MLEIDDQCRGNYQTKLRCTHHPSRVDMGTSTGGWWVLCTLIRTLSIGWIVVIINIASVKTVLIPIGSVHIVVSLAVLLMVDHVYCASIRFNGKTMAVVGYEVDQVVSLQRHIRRVLSYNVAKSFVIVYRYPWYMTIIDLVIFVLSMDSLYRWLWLRGNQTSPFPLLTPTITITLWARLFLIWL